MILNEKIRNMMRYSVGTSMGKEDEEIIELINILEHLMLLPNIEGEHDNLSFGKGYADLLNFFAENENLVEENNFIICVEAFLKKVIRLVYPEDWKARWNQFENEVSSGVPAKAPWMLASLYKKIGVVDVDWNADPNLYRGRDDLLEFYVRIYQARNKAMHGLQVRERTALFIVYLDVVDKYKEYIEKAYTDYSLTVSINAKEYCAKIVDEYERKSLQREYEVVQWEEPQSHSEISTDKIENALNGKVIKLIGAPGVGKSSALAYCRYITCKDILAGKSTRLPVMVPLWETENMPLEELIARELKISVNDVPGLLRNGKISLYLDGYNEILDDDARESTARTIDSMVHEHEYLNLSVVVTDRAEISDPPVASNAIAYNLKPLSEKQIAQLFVKKISAKAKDINEDREMKQLFIRQDGSNSKLSDALSWLLYDKDMCTPFALEKMIEYALSKRTVPASDDFWWDYMDFVLFREGDEKKELRMETFKDMLTAISKAVSDDESVKKSELLEIIKNFDSKMSNEQINAYIKLMNEMRIFICDNHKYRFLNEKIWDYFNSEMYV